MKTALGALPFICLNIHAFAGDNPIDFRASTLPDKQNDRPLELVVWYPSVTTATPKLIAVTRLLGHGGSSGCGDAHLQPDERVSPCSDASEGA
jgi:hypothetical protein